MLLECWPYRRQRQCRPSCPSIGHSWEAAQGAGKNSDGGLRESQVQTPAPVVNTAGVAWGSLTPERLFAHPSDRDNIYSSNEVNKSKMGRTQ